MLKRHLSIGRILSATILGLVAMQLGINFIKERRMIDEINSDPVRTVCIGRSVVDLPVRLDVTYGGGYFAFWHFQTNVESVEAFDARVSARELQLAAAKNGYGHRSLEINKQLSGNWHGRIYQHSRESLKLVKGEDETNKDVLLIEAFVHADGVSFDITGSLATEKEFKSLEQVISRLKLRQPDEIPDVPGFCIDRGIVVGHENPTLSEGITMFVGDRRIPTLSIVFDSTAGTKDPQTLLERAAVNDVRLEFPSSFNDLRTGPRRLNEHDGGEVVESVKEDDGRKNHSFMWQSNPIKEDVYHPQITIEMATGHSNELALMKTPFTDGEAVALWDRVTSTLRTRPFK
jgi:hypothetical protein